MATLSLIIFFALIVGPSSFVQAECNIPSEFWCDDLETATACGVVKQCEAFGQPNANKLVDIGVYYETMCPDAKEFIVSLTSPFIQIGNIINITLVPYGNTKTHKNSSATGGYTFECEHGPDECTANMIQTCAMHLYKNISVYYPFIECMENLALAPVKAAPMCARVHKLDYSKIMDCVHSPLGVDLQLEMGQRTEALKPQYTPWITLNGVHTEHIELLAMMDIFVLICRTYTGTPVPKACIPFLDVGHSLAIHKTSRLH